MVGLLGVPIGAGISWSNRPVRDGGSVVSSPIGAGDSLWGVIQLELDTRCCVIQLELDVLCRVIE
jgi:hypothetical protein